MLSYVITVVICLAGLSHVTRAADCIVNNFTVQANFDIAAYAGTWYELYSLLTGYTPWMEYYDKYTLNNSTGTPQLDYLYAGRDNGTCKGGYNGPLTSDPAVPAKMSYKDDVSDMYWNYWVLGTDYTTYTVFYGCLSQYSNNTCSQPTASVRSRSRSNFTDAAVWTNVNNLLKSVCLDISMMTVITQNASPCPEMTTVAPTTTTAKGKASGLMAPVSELLLTMLLLIITLRPLIFSN